MSRVAESCLSLLKEVLKGAIVPAVAAVILSSLLYVDFYNPSSITIGKG